MGRLDHPEFKLAFLFQKSRNKPDITTVLVDTYNYWLGTELGLIQIPKAGFFYFNKDSISFPWGIIEDPNGNMIVADFLNGLYSIAPDQTLKVLSKESRWYFHPCKDEKGRIYLYKETEIYQLESGKLKLIPELTNHHSGLTACLYLFWSPSLKNWFVVKGEVFGFMILKRMMSKNQLVLWQFSLALYSGNRRR